MSILLPETQKRIDGLKKQEADQLAENQSQNEIARQQRLTAEQGAKDARERERETECAEEAEKLKAELKSDFMQANPSASDEDFERLYQDMRGGHLKAMRESETDRTGTKPVQLIIESSEVS